MISDDLIKIIDELNHKYGLEWVGDDSWRLDYIPLNGDIIMYTIDDFDYDEYRFKEYLEEEFKVVKPRIDGFFKELNERIGSKIFSYKIDDECENRILFKFEDDSGWYD